MIDGLKPHTTYTDSGLPWLGKIPSHWEVRRNGRLFVQRNETGFPDLPILEVSLRTGVRIRDFENSTRKQVMSDKDKYKRAKQGDIAYNMMRMWQGAVGVAPVDGLISPAYIVAKPLLETDSRYYQYLFRTGAYMDEVNKFSRGIVSDRNRLYWEDFKQMPSPFPPPEEQAAIVRFLHHAEQRIRRYIRAKRQLIALLNEQQQAIIHHAVTQGLDPNVSIKPSGVEWVGYVPDHWEVRRLKFVSKIIYGSSPHNSTYNDDGIGTVLVNGPDEYSKEDFGFTRSVKWTTAPVKFAPAGALLFCLRGSTTARLNICHSDVSIGRGVAAIVANEEPSYLTNVMMALRTHLKTTFRGSTFPSVTSSDLNNYWVPNPPFEEQKQISEYINHGTKQLNETVETANREIGLLLEYRNRLIVDVVAGKLDVREAAEKLPDELEGTAEDTDLLDEDATGDESELDAEPEEVEA